MLTVLVVEYDDGLREHLLGVVQEGGFVGLGARDTREGLVQLRAQTVEAIFTDYVLDPHRQTGCWMLLIANSEKRLESVGMIVICTVNPHVRPPTSLPRAKVVRKPMELLEIHTYLRQAYEMKRRRGPERL